MPPVRVTSSAPDAVVEGRLLHGDGYVVLFGFNRGDKEVKVKFGVKTEAGRVAAADLETGEAVPVVRDGDRAVVEKALKPGEVWVVRIDMR